MVKAVVSRQIFIVESDMGHMGEGKQTKAGSWPNGSDVSMCETRNPESRDACACAATSNRQWELRIGGDCQSDCGFMDYRIRVLILALVL